MTDDDLTNIDFHLLDIKSGDIGHLRADYPPAAATDAPTTSASRRWDAHVDPLCARTGLSDDSTSSEWLIPCWIDIRRVRGGLRFHQMGSGKWEKLGLTYPLKNVEPPVRSPPVRARTVPQRQRTVRTSTLESIVPDSSSRWMGGPETRSARRTVMSEEPTSNRSYSGSTSRSDDRVDLLRPSAEVPSQIPRVSTAAGSSCAAP